MKFRPLKVLTLIIMMGVLLLWGCSKLTQENYDKIKPGMTYGQVKAIIGNPDECDSAFAVKKCEELGEL